MEKKLFNAKEGLKDFDPTIDKTYCGPGCEYEVGNKFESLTLELKSEYEKEVTFKIGQFVMTNIRINEASPETKTAISRPIGKSEIIDILFENKEWRLRVKYLLCNNYKGNLWPHYTDVKVEHCHFVN